MSKKEKAEPARKRKKRTSEGKWEKKSGLQGSQVHRRVETSRKFESERRGRGSTKKRQGGGKRASHKSSSGDLWEKYAKKGQKKQNKIEKKKINEETANLTREK